MPRQLLLLVVVLPFLQGCGDHPGVNTPEPHPATPFTWAEWVAREAPKRPAEYIDYYHTGRGLPNMSKWRPEDFLPEEYLKAEHADICSLPQEARDKIISMDIPSLDARLIVEQLQYAKRGFPQAQAGLGWFCLAHNVEFAESNRKPGDPPIEITTKEAYEWARRGAASGHPEAMYQLGRCMEQIEHDAYFGRATVPVGPFWRDEMHYWYWRSASALDWQGLQRAFATVSDRGRPPTVEEAFVQKYKWLRLWELQSVFRRDFRPPFAFIQEKPWTTVPLDVEWGRAPDKRLVKRADEALAQWLKKHPDVWESALRLAKRRRGHVYCPGEPGYLATFDFDGLRRKLAPYGVQVAAPLSH